MKLVNEGDIIGTRGAKVNEPTGGRSGSESRPGACFSAGGSMEVDVRGAYQTSSERARVRIELALADESLEAFRLFMAHGYPEVPGRYPPVSVGSFEDLRVDLTLRWPPLYEEFARSFAARLVEEHDEYERRVEALPEDIWEEQEGRLLDEYEARVETVLDEFEEAVEDPAAHLLSSDTPEAPGWSVGGYRYERWAYAAAEKVSSDGHPQGVAEAEEALVQTLQVSESAGRDELRRLAATLLDVCGADTWDVHAAEDVPGDAETGALHLDAINLDTHEYKRVVLTAKDFGVRSTGDVRMLHARLSAEIPRPSASQAGAAAEALVFVDEMERSLADCWEMAEDLGIGEEVLQARTAIEKLGWALTTFETGEGEPGEEEG